MLREARNGVAVIHAPAVLTREILPHVAPLERSRGAERFVAARVVIDVMDADEERVLRLPGKRERSRGKDRVLAHGGILTRRVECAHTPRVATKTKPAAKKAKNANKTTATSVDPLAFIDSVKSEGKRRDAQELVAMMREITGEPPRMWGPTIVGFGSVHYRYDSGREGDICLTGFSPRTAAIVVYLGADLDNGALLAKLGKHKTGKGCLYVNKLDDVDRGILRKLIEHSVRETRKRYPSNLA
jgi:hypothetical protein